MKTGIVIPFFDRREHVIKCLDSLKSSQIPEGLTFYFILDYGSKQVDDLFDNADLACPIIRYRAQKHLNINGCLKVGWDYLFENGFDLIGNLDSDALVSPDWFYRIVDLHRRFPDHVITGFNTDSHRSFSDGDGYLLKKSIGGINTLFSRDLYQTSVRPSLDVLEWDWKMSRAMELPFVVARPSVIQHLGAGLHAHTDIAVDFIPKSGSIVPSFQERSIYPPFYTGKISVIMPCRNRNDMLRLSLPYWLSQSYQRFDLIIVDYNSDTPVFNTIWQIAEKFRASINLSKDVCSSSYEKYPKITVLRMENLDDWNMSHALNYGIRYSTSDIISIAGCDTTPDPSYLEMVATCTTANVATSVWCGRISFQRSRWYELNGYQEMCTKWGGEDTDFRARLSSLGVTLLEMNVNLCASISHPQIRVEEKGLFNLYRCNDYRDQHGCIANYTLFPGNDQPVTTSGLYENSIFFAKTKEPIQVATIAKRCCYAGQIDELTYFYIVPAVVEENIFVDAILEKSVDVWSERTFKSVWHILAEPEQWMK